MKLSYKTFFWNFGTTSFRTRQMNSSIETQLDLLSEFWKDEENAKCGWEKEFLMPDQPFNIYEIKDRYYDFMRDNGFIVGNDKIKYKAARQKTSGLVDIGLINRNHRLTDVGLEILRISKEGNYNSDNLLSISNDSLIYLTQLLKYTVTINNNFVRPYIVILYLLSQLGSLSNEEFTYLAPLCISEEITSFIIKSIKNLREGKVTLNEIIYDIIMRQKNYKDAYTFWMNSTVTMKLITSIGMNRKSRKYDEIYYPFYLALRSFFVEKNYESAVEVFNISKRLKLGAYWRELLFNTGDVKEIEEEPINCMNFNEFSIISNETELKKTFFKYLHLFKVKSTLYDYFDLNRRYIKLSNIILFSEGYIKFDMLPKALFNKAMPELYKLAFTNDENIYRLTSLKDICPSLDLNENILLNDINQELGIKLDTIEDVYTEINRQKYERLNNLIKTKFSDKQLLELLNNFDLRNDEEISKAVTDNADIPTIFEFVLGIIWYKTSEYKGRLLDYLKLSLDADLLPVTHASGGEADIVYEYSSWPPFYPKHKLLLEATLSDGTNQRRMEMEPVSRHLGRHLLQTREFKNYCIFVSPYLDLNVISDFKNRKNIPFYDIHNENDFIPGMKIIPLTTNDLRQIIIQGKKYKELYSIFEDAYKKSDAYSPKKWYDELVKIKSTEIE